MSQIRAWCLAAMLSGCATTSGGLTHHYSGTSTSLEQLRGHVVVLNFWAEWCPHCIDELPIMAEIVQKAGPEVLLLPTYWAERPRTGSKMLRWLDAQPSWFTHQIVWADRSIRDRFDLNALPKTVIIGRDGNVFKVITGSIAREPERFREVIKESLEVQPTPPKT